MRYTLMFRDAEKAERSWQMLSDSERDQAFEEVERWFSAHAAKITHSRRLKSHRSATTLRPREDSRPGMLDGPFCADRDAIGGYVEVDVSDLGEALDMVRGWPGHATVEIRPVM
ncbi:YciI family protein [Streptosporangium sp. NPDC050855]|uniref:YciI family protein n=1 Tax=Streptosporangium sp. NPDC050855 TaxID=3366194 RepID=UPI00379C302E